MQCVVHFFPPPVVGFKISVICSVISDFFVNFLPESLYNKISRSIKFNAKVQVVIWCVVHNFTLRSCTCPFNQTSPKYSILSPSLQSCRKGLILCNGLIKAFASNLLCYHAIFRCLKMKVSIIIKISNYAFKLRYRSSFYVSLI